MWFLFAFIGILLGSSYLLLRWKYTYWLRNGIPSIEPKFPYGSIPPARKKHLSMQLQDFYRKRTGECPAVGIYNFFKPTLLILDLQLVQCVMVKDFQYFQSRGAVNHEKQDPLSAHLINLEYDRWKPLRQKLTPTFTSGKMKFMYSTIVGVTNEFVKCVSEAAKTDNEVEIHDLFARYTTDIIGTCAFGIECNSLKDPNTEFRLMANKVLKSTYLPFFKRMLASISPKVSEFFGIVKHRKDVIDFFLNVVRETVEYREKNNVSRNDFMDLLIQLKKTSLTMNEVAAQAFVFFMAGYETSSTTLSYCLYELSLEKNKHIQDKARKEIQSVLERHNGELTYEALNEMVYCEQIINETMRKHPSVAYLVRIATKSYNVPNTKLMIPKGMRVWIPVLAIHHDPAIYPNPNEFIPERFSSEETRKRPSGAFLPFGDGPRNCIGLRFGMLQTRLGLVSLLRNFEFSTCSRTPIPLKYSPNKLLLLPAGGIWLKVNHLQK